MFRFLSLLLVFFCLCACALPRLSGSGAADAEYRSLVALPEAGTFYHFSRGQLLADEGDYSGAIEALSRAIESDPGSPYLHLSLARIYLESGLEEEGLAAVKEALRLAPGSTDAELLLGNIYYRREDDEKAIVHFKRALELNPEEEVAYLHLGVAYARNGDYEKAAETLKSALNKHPDAIGVAMTLARLYREMELESLAKDVYRQVIARHPEFAAAYAELGLIFERNEDIGQAIDLYRQALAVEEDAGVRHRVARLLIIGNRFEEAIAELKHILHENPNDLDAGRKIGLIYLEQQNWPAAEEVFASILAQRPDLETIHFYLGMSLERQEKWEEALAAFQAVSPDAESYADARLHLSFLLHRLSRTGEAIALLEEHIGQTGRPEHFAYLASLHEEENNFDSALAAIERGLIVYPGDIGLLYQRGLLYERRGERPAAVTAMRQVLEMKPNHAEALNYIAYSYAEAGENLQEAMQMAQRALAVKPEGHIHDTLGWVYFKLGRLQEARQQLETAVKLLPTDPLVYEHLGDIYRALKQKEKTAAAYRKALALDPKAENVRKKLEGLR